MDGVRRAGKNWHRAEIRMGDPREIDRMSIAIAKGVRHLRCPEEEIHVFVGRQLA